MPIWSLVIGSAEWLLGNAFLFLLSLVSWSFLRFHRFPIDLALLLFYFLFNTTFFVLVIGVAGILERHILAGVCFFASILIIWLYQKRLLLTFREIKNLWADFLRRIIRRPLLATAFIIVAIIMGLRMLAHVWFLSPYVWDTLTYHLPKVADWVQYGKLVALPTPVTRSYWPANFELFQTWFVLFFHHDFLIEAAGLPFYLLAIICVYSSSHSLELSRSWSALLAVIYALTPSVLMNAVSCKNDIAVAALYLFSLAVMLDYRRQKESAGSHAAVIAAAILMAMGTKPYIIFVLPGLILIGLWCIRDGDPGSWQTGGRDNGFPRSAFLLTAALILGTYWYIRNYMVFENPFYPADFRLFGHLVFGDGHAYAQQGTFKWESLLRNFLDLAEKKLFDSSGPYEPDLSNMSGWGWFAFSIGIPALIFAVIKRPDFRWLMGGFLLSLAGLFSMVSPDPWNMRFTLWFPAVFALAYGIVGYRCEFKFMQVGFMLLAGICSALNLLGSNVYTSPSAWISKSSIPVWERAATIAHLKPALLKIPPSESLAYFARGDTRIYPLYGPGYTRKIYYLKPHDSVDIIRKMEETGVRYFLFLETGDTSLIRRMDMEIHLGRMSQLEDRLYYITDAALK